MVLKVAKKVYFDHLSLQHILFIFLFFQSSLVVKNINFFIFDPWFDVEERKSKYCGNRKKKYRLGDYDIFDLLRIRFILIAQNDSWFT
jgi:hypothetical protein